MNFEVAINQTQIGNSDEEEEKVWMLFFVHCTLMAFIIMKKGQQQKTQKFIYGNKSIRDLRHKILVILQYIVCIHLNS